MESSKKSGSKKGLVESVKKLVKKTNKGASSSKSKIPLVRINTDEFTHVNETSFSRPGPININSDSPTPHELYERHYGINQENEEVETDEQLNLDEEVDLDDTPTSPAADLNTVNSIGIEAPPPVGTTRPLIIPTRGKTKVQRSLKSHV